MNSDILVVGAGAPPDDHLVSVAAAVGRLLSGEPRTRELATSAEPERAAVEVLAALAETHTLGCVLTASPEPNALCWSVVGMADKPVVLVPPGARLPRPDVTRALLPLDGTEESAIAVAYIVHMLDKAGVDLVVLHVFDATTVPRYWDQHAHAQRAWTDEFLSRSRTPTGARLELRSGTAGELVVRVAMTEDVDIIALGWSRTTASGRAQTVRASVLEAPVPVLLVPIAASS